MPLQRNISFQKDYGALVEQGTLTMDTGAITNDTETYSITDSGMAVEISTGSSLDRERSFSIVDSNDNVKGYFWGTSLDDSIRLVSEDNLVVEAKSGKLLLSATDEIQATAPVRLQSYTRSAILAISNPKAGQLVWNNTADRGAYYDGSDWRHLNDGGTI